MEDMNKINDANAKLIETIKKFTSSYTALSPVGKKAFENQVSLQLKKEDERTKHLYAALIEAAKDGMPVDKTIQSMEKADRQAKYGI